MSPRKVLDQEPSFLQECRTRGDNLYVVTEAVKLVNETVLQDSSSVNATGTFSIPWSFMPRYRVVLKWGRAPRAQPAQRPFPGSLGPLRTCFQGVG